MTDNPWIAHKSPKAYLQRAPFGIETISILAQKKDMQYPLKLALSEISRFKLITAMQLITIRLIPQQLDDLSV